MFFQEAWKPNLRVTYYPTAKNEPRFKVPAPIVMVVEDDSQSLYLIQRYARTSGYQLVNAWQGEEALTLARQARPVVILLDIVLSGIMGWDVLRALRADPITCQIPVIICSALDEAENAQQAGAAGYLRKPVYYDDFLAALKDAGVQP